MELWHLPRAPEFSNSCFGRVPPLAAFAAGWPARHPDLVFHLVFQLLSPQRVCAYAGICHGVLCHFRDRSPGRERLQTTWAWSFRFVLFTSSLNAVAYFLELYLMLGRIDRTAAAWCALALGAVYIFLGGFLHTKTGGHTGAALRHLHLALSTVFITLAIAIRFESQWISIGWFVEAAGLVTIGFWRRSSFVRWQALVLIAVTIVKVFAYDIWRLERGYRIVSFFVLGLLLLAVSFIYQRDWLRLSLGSAAGKSVNLEGRVR